MFASLIVPVRIKIKLLIVVIIARVLRVSYMEILMNVLK